MKKGGRTSVEEEIVKRESAALKAIWDACNPKDRRTQAEFGELHGVGNQSAVGQFLRGKIPLSLKAAKGFAKGLNCLVADFSPRLAELESSWPFDLVDRERYEALPPAFRHKAQVRMMDEIEALERDLQANGTHS